MSEYAHLDRLEAHYRRLLAVYPPGHRARYGEEMIDVLMASSAPGQRRPDIREALDLFAAGLRARLGAGVGGGLSPASRAAATAFGFLASIVLATVSLYQVTAGIAQRGMPGDPVPYALLAQLPYRSLVMGMIWTLVACACAAGLRWVAAPGAVLGFVGVAIGIGSEYDSAPYRFVSSWWLVTLSVSAAACLVGTSGVGRWRRVLSRDSDGVRPLGWRVAVTFGAGGLLTVIEPLVDRALMVVEPQGDGWMMRSASPSWRYRVAARAAAWAPWCCSARSWGSC